MIVDAHSHVWDEKYASKDYLKEALSHRKRVGDVDAAATQHWMPITREAWITELKDAGVEKAIVMAFDLTRVFDTKIPDEFIWGYVKEYPKFLVGYSSVEPLDSVGKFKRQALVDVEKAVNQYGFKGLKLYPWYGNYSPDDKALYPLYEKCLELGIPILSHVSPENLPKAYLKYGTPLPLDNVATDFPDLKLGIAHFGSPWMTECCLLMQEGTEHLRRHFGDLVPEQAYAADLGTRHGEGVQSDGQTHVRHRRAWHRQAGKEKHRLAKDRPQQALAGIGLADLQSERNRRNHWRERY